MNNNLWNKKDGISASTSSSLIRFSTVHCESNNVAKSEEYCELLCITLTVNTNV